MLLRTDSQSVERVLVEPTRLRVGMGHQYPRDWRAPRPGGAGKMSIQRGGKSVGAAYHTRNSRQISAHAAHPTPSRGHGLRQQACLLLALSGIWGGVAQGSFSLHPERVTFAPIQARTKTERAYGPGRHLGRRRPGPFFRGFGVRRAGLCRGLSESPRSVPPAYRRTSLLRCSSRWSSRPPTEASPPCCDLPRTDPG